MNLTVTPSEYRAFLRQDLSTFNQRCFYELNPYHKLIVELASRCHRRRP